MSNEPQLESKSQPVEVLVEAVGAGAGDTVLV